MKLRLVAAFAGLAGALLLVPSALGWGINPVQPRGGACGSPPCYTEFTVDGVAPPSGITLDVSTQNGNVIAKVQNSASAPFFFDLEPPLSNASAVHIKLDVGTYDPAVVATTGLASAISTSTSDAAHHTVTIDAKPSSSSWKFSGCTTSGCGDATTKADVDFKSLLLMAVTDLAGSPADWAGPMHGAWMSLNAESNTFPIFNASDNSVSFSVASPHLKADGVTPQTGFFIFFLPDALLVKMGYADPSTVAQGNVTVTRSDGVSVTFNVTYNATLHGVFLKAGTGGDLPPWPYSAPTFTVTPQVTKTLTVTKAGTGSGTVTSSPAGIDCGATCSHDFTSGASVTLTAAAASGSTFGSWSGDCTGSGTCTLTLSANRAVTATFTQNESPPPPPPPKKCVVPNVKGKTLAAATSAIKAAHCSLGKVQKATSKKKKGTVIAQNPPPGKKLAKGSKVNLVLSRGKK